MDFRFLYILGDPGADSGGEGKSRRAGTYGTKKSKERREEPLGDNVLQDQFQTLAAVLASDWCRKTFLCVFLPNQKAERLRPFVTWSGKTLSPGALLAVLYFSSIKTDTDNIISGIY